jgi:hypothetical protein
MVNPRKRIVRSNYAAARWAVFPLAAGIVALSENARAVGARVAIGCCVARTRGSSARKVGNTERQPSRACQATVVDHSVD